MRALKAIVFFGVKIQLLRLSSWIYFGVFFSLAFFTIFIAGGGAINLNVSIGLFADNALLNSPFNLHTLISLFGGFFGILIVAPVFGQSLYRDFHCRMDQILFSLPVRREIYLLGRWLGALLSLLIIFSGIALGLWLGGLNPWVQKELFAPHKLIHYLFPYLTSILPNLVIFGSLFFALVCWTKKISTAYISGILLFICYLIAGSLEKGIDNKLTASLLDPFGMSAFSYLTDYWPVEERNTKLIGWSHFYLYNRLLWLAIGAGSLAWAVLSFKDSAVGIGSKRQIKKESKSASRTALSPIPLNFGWASQIKQLVFLSVFEFSQAFKNIYFLLIYLAGVSFIFVLASQSGKVYGAPVLPVTYAMLDIIDGSFGLFAFILIVYYSGELVWRERGLKLSIISDALPYSNGVSFLSKIFCLAFLQALLLGTVMACGMLTQLFKGYFHLEPALYIKYLFGARFIVYSFMSLLALFIHTIASNKYLGHFILVVIYIISAFLPFIGVESSLYMYGSTPRIIYSDMNGFGPYLKSFFWFALYWSLFAGMLAGLTLLLWRRGINSTIKTRALELKRRMSRPVLTGGIFLFSAWASTGAYIYYNTEILNRQYTSKEERQLKYLYETQYKKFEKWPQPAIKKADLELDIFPYKRELRAKGRFVFKNLSLEPIENLFFHKPSQAQFVQEFSSEWSRPASISSQDSDFNLIIYKLEKPLRPGEELALKFQTFVSHPGFTYKNTPNEIAANGTFFLGKYFPALGYRSNFELSDDRRRRSFGLEPKPRAEKADDAKALQRAAMGYARFDFSAVISTAKDQIALAPGALKREWAKGDRRYFHYESERPIWGPFSFLSGRYAVRKDKWKNVDIFIYHHPAHDTNINRMLKAIKKGLEYFTKEFSPYQYSYFRIAEFPRYKNFAISLPGIIPYSESMGFIFDVEDKKDSIDYPFYVTAHELAHQWWAHQVTSAHVQGAAALHESLSQYFALLLMEKEYGPHSIKKFLKYELDGYLSGRAMETKMEEPLMLTASQQYIHYHKGSLIMYALKDYVGEKALNSAIRKYIQKTAWQKAPFTTMKEFVESLQKNLPKKFHGLIDDFFKRITFYDNQALSATAQKKADGGHTVYLKASSKKWRAEGLGKRTKQPLGDLKVDIGVQNKKGDFIYLQKHSVSAKGVYEIRLEASAGQPHKAGIDPLHKLIDRKPNDNEIAVKLQ